jgi:uncharacterized phage-associated protein
MNPNATALANYFIDLANRDEVGLRQLGLMKRVYITHGFCLAIFDKSALDPRFDVVEAWKNGPVIPSVYHSFKYNRNEPITEKSIIIDWESDKFNFTTPELEDTQIRNVADMVWNRYRDFDDFELVKLTHKTGSPWALCYEEGENKPIPDIYTKTYYKKLIK